MDLGEFLLLLPLSLLGCEELGFYFSDTFIGFLLDSHQEQLSGVCDFSFLLQISLLDLRELGLLSLSE